jgi:GAF domain-containing protein
MLSRDGRTVTDTRPSPDARIVETFVALSDTLVEDFGLMEFLGTLTTRTVELTGAAQAGILLADRNGELQVMAASTEQVRHLELYQVQNHEGPCRECFTTGVRIATDLEVERSRWPGFAPRALESGFRSVLAVPMRLRGVVLGALNLFITSSDGVDAVDATLVQAFADIATIGLLQRRTMLNAQLHVGQIEHALTSRIVIEQAKGIIAEQGHISVDDAFEQLRSHSRRHNRPMHDLAPAVISGEMSVSDLSA